MPGALVLYELGSIGIEYEEGTARIDTMTVSTVKPIHFVENWRKDRRDEYTYKPNYAKVVLQISYGTGYEATLEADVYADDEFIEHIYLEQVDAGSQVKQYSIPARKFELRNVKFSTNDQTANTFFSVELSDSDNWVSTGLQGDGKVFCELWRDGEQIYSQLHDLMSVQAASGAIAAAKAISDIMIQFMSVMIVFSMVILIIRGLIEAFMGAVRL